MRKEVLDILRQEHGTLSLRQRKNEEHLDSIRVQKEKEKALKISISEGSASSISTSIGDNFITPFALALRGSALHVGILSALSGLVAPVAQFFGSTLMEHHPRKKIVLRFVLLQALTWLPVALIAFLYFSGSLESSAIYLLILFYAILSIFGGLAHPAWFSWMGDLVPEKERGKYFGKRNTINGSIGLVVSLIGAFLLDYFKAAGIVLVGLGLFFIISSISRLISYHLFHRQFVPQFKLKKGYYFSLWDFVKRYDNFGKFSVYQAAFNFAIMVASPFFAVYMLEDLQFSYITFTIVSLSSSLFILLFTPLVGKFSDKYGNKKLLLISSLLFSLNPALWMIIKTPLLLILIPSLLVGLANAAMAIATTNFTYDSVSQQKRGICVAYMNILAGLGVFVGSLLGGFLVKYWHPQTLNPFMFVFAIAAILRLAVTLFFLPKIKEEKRVAKLRFPHHPLHLHLGHPFRQMHFNVGWFNHFSLDKKASLKTK
jgi:MFS family permease